MERSGAAPALTLRGAAYVYPNTVALTGVDLDVQEGSYVGVVGPNGCGKTTLAYLIAGILAPTSGVVDTYGKRVGLVLSNPLNQIVSVVVEEDIAFGPENLGLGPDEIEERVHGSLTAVHATYLRKSLTSELSGGELAKVAHAGQLAMNADVLILDEGIAMLDPANRTKIIDLLGELNSRFGTTVIHISHRLDDLRHATKVLVMDRGRILHQTGGVFELVDLVRSLNLPWLEIGPELAYRHFLRDVGILEEDLEKATETLALFIKNNR